MLASRWRDSVLIKVNGFWFGFELFPAVRKEKATERLDGTLVCLLPLFGSTLLRCSARTHLIWHLSNS